MSRLAEYQAAVAEHGSMRAAARSLGVSVEAIR
jgi:DNA-binding transcriptional LysR family regulator